MPDSNDIAGVIAIAIGIALFWKAAPMGEFFGPSRNDAVNTIVGRVAAVIWVVGGLYFILS